ncbi:MAG: hypothetical protein GY788_14655 [bacterium]|nr:hypothetical protein [bacterium]
MASRADSSLGIPRRREFDPPLLRGHLYEGVDQAAMEGLDRLRSEAQADTRRVECRFDASR